MLLLIGPVFCSSVLSCACAALQSELASESAAAESVAAERAALAAAEESAVAELRRRMEDKKAQGPRGAAAAPTTGRDGA